MFYTCKVWTAQLILTLSLTAYLKIFLYPDSISPVGMIFLKIICLYKHLFIFLFFIHDGAFLHLTPIFSIYCTFSLQIEDIFEKVGTELNAINLNYTLV